MAVLAPGTPAPDFTLTRFDGGTLTRADLDGRITVLVFFPAAFSGVCTDQFEVYQRHLAEWTDLGAVVYGVSCDQIESAEAFRTQLEVDIELVSDFEPKGEASRAFGVYWSPTGVSNRALVVVGPDGTVAWSWEGEHPGTSPGPELVREGIDAASSAATR